MKKGIIIASLIALAAAGATVGALLAVNANADDTIVAEERELLTELKVGKYYLENGTEDEYIEVYEDGSIQFFGLDYLELVKELNKEYLDTVSEEQYQSFIDAHLDQQDFWRTKHYYVLSEHTQTVGFSDEPVTEDTTLSLYSIGYDNENTLVFDKNLGYIYHYAE